jgi:quinolinate synthase
MLPTILPEHLTRLTDSETDARIRELKNRLGERLVILGHHYQRDEVIKFADIRGDSFKLAEWAGKRKNAEYIVFAACISWRKARISSAVIIRKSCCRI